MQLTITPDAASDLRERVARSSGDAVLIIGPVRPGYSMAESAEEAEHLEIAYGLAQPVATKHSFAEGVRPPSRPRRHERLRHKFGRDPRSGNHAPVGCETFRRT